MLSALEHKHGLGCGRDHTTPDMVKGRGSKETAEEKAAKILKAKKSEDARVKKLSKKAATKASAEQSLQAHQDSQKAMEDDNEQDLDPIQNQLVELREVIGALKSKLIEVEAKVDGQSAKIHALQMRHVATPDDPIDVDLEAVVDREIFCDAGKDSVRKLDIALMANYNAKHSNVRVIFINY